MKFSELISKVFTSNELSLVQGIEKKLRSRRKSEQRLVFFSILTLLFGLTKQLSGTDVVQWQYLKNFSDLLAFTFKGNWHQVSLYYPVLLTYLVIVLAILFLYFLVIRTRFLELESEGPFRYTFWVKTFEEVKDTPPTTLYKLDRNDRLNLLHHDLMEKLNSRIKRLSLLNLDGLTVDSTKTGPAYFESIRELQSKLVAHIQIDGTYFLREERDNEWVIHVMPRVRIGSLENPSILAYSVKFPLEGDKKLTASQYNQFIERVYSSVATEVYKQIELDIHEKMNLFRTSRLRAVALFNEAEDFARSNTIDAYDRAITLYRESLRHFEISQIKPLTHFLIKSIFWRLKVGPAYLQAKIQIGFIKCLIYRRIVSTFTGRYSNPIFEIRPIIDEMLERLSYLHEKLKRSRDPLPAFLMFPKDSWIRHRLRPLLPSESTFENRSQIYFDANMVAALGYYYLRSYCRAPEYLRVAKSINPKLSERNPLFLMTAGLIEPDLDESILLFRHATELAPDFQIAQYILAEKSEMLFRMKNDLSVSRVVSVIREYDKVLNINPGNVAALAAQGYLWWLVEDLQSAKKKFEEGNELKSIATDTFVGQLSYGLARIAAEEGRFNDSYDLYHQAISADPGIGTYSTLTSVAAFTFYYDQIVPKIYNRYRDFQNRVRMHRKRQIRGTYEFGPVDIKDPLGLALKLKAVKAGKNDNGVSATISDDKTAKVDTVVKNDKVVKDEKKDGVTSVQMFLHERLDEKTKKILDDMDGSTDLSLEMEDTLVDVLNGVLSSRTFYDKERFAGVILSEEASRLVRQNPQGKTLVRLNRLLLEEAFPGELFTREEVSKQTINTVLSYVLNDHGNACLGYYARFGELSKLEEAIETFRKARKLDRENIIVNYNQYLGYTWRGTRKNNDSDPFENIENILIKYPNQPILVFALAQSVLREPEEISQKKKQLEELKNRSDIKPEKQEKQIASTNEVASKDNASEVIQRKQAVAPTVGRKTRQDLEKELETLERSWTRLVIRVSELSIKNSKFATLLDPSVVKGETFEEQLKELNAFFSRNKISSERLNENDVSALKVLAHFLLVKKFKIQHSSITNFFKNIIDLFWPEDPDLDTIFEREEFKDPNLRLRRNKRIDYWLKQDPVNFSTQTWVSPLYFEKITDDINIQLKRGLDKISALALNDGSYENWVADIYYSFGDYADASNLYSRAIQNNPGIASYHFNLGRAYNGLKDWDAAIIAITKATELSPTTPSYFNYLANTYYDKRDFHNALENYRIAISINSHLAVYHSNLGLAHYQLKEWADAIKGFEAAIGLDTTNANYFNDLGNALYNFGDYKNASVNYQKAIGIDSTSAVYQANIIAAFEKTGDVTQSQNYFNNALTIKPKDPVFLSELGNALYQNSQWIKAIQSYEKVVELDSKNAGYFNSLGNAYYKHQEYAKAGVCYQKAIDFSPKLAVYHSNLGLANYALFQWQKAIVSFTKAAELNSQNGDYFNDLGNAHYNLGDFKNAAENYKNAIAINPKLAVYYSNLIAALDKNGEPGPSGDWFTKALEEEPSNVRFQYDLGTTLYQNSQYQKSSEALERVVNIDPYNAVYRSELGNSYDRLAQYEKAAEQFLKAFELNPASDAYLQSLVTMTLWITPSKALEYLDKALVVAPDNAVLKDEIAKLNGSVVK